MVGGGHKRPGYQGMDGSLGAQWACCLLLLARQSFLLRHKSQGKLWGPRGKPPMTFSLLWAPRVV